MEANNRIRELEGDERREIIRILTEFSNTLRPSIPARNSYDCSISGIEGRRDVYKRQETGIRTPGTSQYNGFQDRRNRPLCHLSKTTVK